MKINEYLNSKVKYTITLEQNEKYNRTIEEFYNECIKKHVDLLYIDKKNNLLSWCKLITDYINDPNSIYWIRKYESDFKDKNDAYDTRRGTLTIHVDNEYNYKYAYSFISNFDAQELYNMIIHIDHPDVNEFITLMKNGKFKFHYDNGKSCKESGILAYDYKGSPKGGGVLNSSGWYFAHIYDVNGSYFDSSKNRINIENDLFPKGVVTDWKKWKEQKVNKSVESKISDIFNFDDERYVRIMCENSNHLTEELLIAQFLRFISPFNYYLVPSTNNEVDCIFGKNKINIGEYHKLSSYVKDKIYNDYIVKDDELLKYYNLFMDKMMVDNERDDESNIGKENINIVYGLNVGMYSVLSKLKEVVVNVDDLYEIYNKYNKDDYVIRLKDLNTKTEKLYNYKDCVNYSDFLYKIYSNINSKFNDIKNIRIIVGLESKVKTVKKQTKVNVSSGTISKKSDSLSDESEISDELKYAVAAYYMRNKVGLKKVEINVLGFFDKLGFVCQEILNELGIENTASNNPYKGLLIDNDIDLEISKANGIFKNTLEEIKKRKL